MLIISALKKKINNAMDEILSVNYVRYREVPLFPGPEARC